MGLTELYFEPSEIQKLREYDLLYYTDGTSPVSDAVYDELKEKAEELYPNHNYFQGVGAPIVNGNKVKLPYVLGSLDKVKPDKIESWIGSAGVDILATEKLDGVSFYVKYLDGKVISAATRGDGEYGQDITDKAKVFCPETDFSGLVEFRAEAMLMDDGLKKANLNRISDNKVPFKNKRNGVAGILNRDGLRNVEYIKPRFYELISCEYYKREIKKGDICRHAIMSGILGESFIADSFTIPVGANVVAAMMQMSVFYNRERDYDVDGIVLSLDGHERENVMLPENKIAYKKNLAPVSATVTGVEWNVSRTGRIKPVVLIEPIELGGVTVQRATGFNAEFIIKNSIEAGTKIELVRSGDVIPHIVKVYPIENRVVPGLCWDTFLSLAVCPSCGSTIERDGVDIVCRSLTCGRKTDKQISHFLRTLGAENITEKTIKALDIMSIEEAYGIDSIYIQNCEGFAQGRTSNVLSEIEKTLTTTPAKFIKALGISGIGERMGKELTVDYSIDQLFNICNDGSRLPLGPKTEAKFRREFPKHKALYEFLLTKGLTFERRTDMNKVSNVSGKLFAITGTMPVQRSEIVKAIEERGGNVKTVSKKTDYLVAADPESTTSKMKKARDFGITIISYEELVRLIKE